MLSQKEEDKGKEKWRERLEANYVPLAMKTEPESN